ncbi:forkhead box protein J2/J3 [Pseudohyphozyma bogoriensis]|nr:forkhead box protein J2/J3 [Pseudohyphozyma bogoriensis]
MEVAISSTSFPLDDEPTRGEDDPFAPFGWSRQLSVSPRLFPTYNPDTTSLSSSSYGLGSYRGLGESPLLGPTVPSSSRHDGLNVGTGLSPFLGPTHLNRSSLGLGVSTGGSNSMIGGEYDWPTSTSPPAPTATTLPSATRILDHASASPPLPSLATPLAPPASLSPTLAAAPSVNQEQPAPPPPDEPEDPRIRAYAKLEFPTFDIYIQKLSVIVGRRPAGASAAPAPPPPPADGDGAANGADPAAPPPITTDIDLGPIRAVSRQHARLYFDYEMGGWALEVLGRNGVVVEGKWKAKGEREGLGKRTKIQIAEHIFFFVLPSMDQEPEEQLGMGAASDDEKEEASDDGHDGGNDSSSLSEVSDSDIELSPMMSPVKPESVPSIRIKVPATGSSNEGDSMASTSNLSSLSLAPPVRAASRGVVYGQSPQPQGAQSGKRLEVLQAARGGKGKGAGKGKGKAKKGKAPPKKVRRASNASIKSEFDDDDEADEEDDRMDEDEEESYNQASPKKAGTKKDDPRRIVIKQPHPVAKKQPKRNLQPLPPLPSIKAESPSVESTPSLPTIPLAPHDLPPLPSVSPVPVASALPPLPPLPATTSTSGAASPASTSAKSDIAAGALPPLPGSPAGSVPGALPAGSTTAAASGSVPAVAATPGAGAPAPAPAAGYPTVPSVLPDGERPALAAPPEDLYTKPPYTYASLIAQAVSSSEHRKLTLNGIYDWITARWPYFSDNQNGWQNSIRHNLTLSRGFLKIPRRDDEPGKGAFWAIDPAQISNFDGLHFRKKVVKPPAPPPPPPKPTPPPSEVPPASAAKPAAKPPVKGRAPGPSLSQPLPIIVSPIPDSYVRPAPPPAGSTPPDELTAALLKDPPIVLHEGKLILNPGIFENLTKEQLDNLQVLPASHALQILQAYVVQHFKERMKNGKLLSSPATSSSNGGAGPSGTARPAGANGAARPAGAPGAKPPIARPGQAGAARPGMVAPKPGVAGARPGVAAGKPVPGGARPAGAAAGQARMPATAQVKAGTPGAQARPALAKSATSTPSPAPAGGPGPKSVAAASPARAGGPAKAATSTAAGKRKADADSDIEIVEPRSKVAKVEGDIVVE